MKTVFSELWVSWTWNTHGTNDETELYIYTNQMRIGRKTRIETKIPFTNQSCIDLLAAIQKVYWGDLYYKSLCRGEYKSKGTRPWTEDTKTRINYTLGQKIWKLEPTIRNPVPIWNLILIQYLWEDHTCFKKWMSKNQIKGGCYPISCKMLYYT